MIDIENSVDKRKKQSLIAAAFFGSCPRCRERTIFKREIWTAPTQFNAQCDSCELDYKAFNVGDGPAAFLTFIMGGLLITFALILELSWHPPFWLHIVLWVPITILMTILLLRIAKGVLLILEFRNEAKEAGCEDIVDDGSSDGA